MSKQPTQYAAKFKAQVVQEMLREEKTISQLAAEHGIHPNQLGRWKATVLAEMPSLFERRDQTAALVAAHQHELEEAYAEVGRVITQLAWLKRKTGCEPPAR
jgi:transposase